MKNLLDKIVAIAAGRNLIGMESLYRRKARRHGVEFVAFLERHRLAVFQDPVTGSSFAIREDEPVESGIRRVRALFGITA